MPGSGLTRTYLETDAGRRRPVELDTIYDDPKMGDRYVVSLIVGYGDEDLAGGDESPLDRAVRDEPDKMLAAAKAALDLTRDGGCDGTHWYVYDRKKKTGRFFEQGEFDDPARD